MAVALASNTTLTTVHGKERPSTRDAVEYVFSISGLCFGKSLFDTRLIISTVKAAVVIYGRKRHLWGEDIQSLFEHACRVGNKKIWCG